MNARLHVTVALSALLGACSLVPDYMRPATPAPARFAAAPASAPAQWPSAAWWHGFGSGELDALMDEAMANNGDLGAAASRITQAEAQVQVANAALYPTLSAGATGSRSQSATAVVAANNFRASASAAYQLDLFGGNVAGADAAVQRLTSSTFDRETVRLTLIGTVASTYFQVLALRDRIALSEDTLANANEVLRLVETQGQIGTVSDLELAQQRSAVASAQSGLAVLRGSERTTLNALAILLGRAPDGFDVTARSLDSLTLPPVLAGLPAELIDRRPDLRKAESDLRAANFDIGSAKAARLPNLSISFERGTAAATTGALAGPGTWLYSLAASLTAPIFAGGRLEGAQRVSEARLDELRQSYRQTVLVALRDVENALVTTDQTERQTGFARTALEEAQRAYRLAELRYRAGTATFLTVLDAQRTVFGNNDTVAQAMLGRFTSTVTLYQALGGGWQPPAP
jgi:multidrug efflux system outer membrane protein